MTISLVTFAETLRIAIHDALAGTTIKCAEFAILALEYAPDRAVELVRKALRSTTPITQEAIVTALCALDLPWCHEEFALALNEKHERGEAAYLQAALLRSESAKAREIAEHWANH